MPASETILSLRRNIAANTGGSPMKKLLLALCAMILATPAMAQDKVTLMLNWYVYGEHAPFFYGKEKGFYAKEGIDLDIQEGRGSGTVTQVVAAKTVQFGYVDVPTMMRAAVKGAPVTSIGIALQTSPMSAMGFTDKNIKKPEDIKGKTVATTPGDSMSQIWPLFLKKTGLKEGDFKIVSGDGTTKLNAVINGQADLLLGYVMDQSMKIKDATGKDWLKDNEALAKRFMAATVKSMEEASKDPKGAAQAVLTAMPKGGKIDTMTQGFELTIPLYKDPTGKSKQIMRVSDENMKETVDVMVEYGGLEAKAKDEIKTYYSNDYLPKSGS
jgi:NitT/TauT family transport system substrate-binding protein